MKKCLNGRCKKEITLDAVFCPYCGRRQESAPKKKKRHRHGAGEGTVYKLSGDRRKPFYAVFKGKSTGRMYATREEAELALEELRKAVRPDLFSYTLEDVYMAWSDVAYRSMGPYSIKGYEQSWKYVPEELRKKQARDIRSDDFQHLIDQMQKRDGLSDSTSNKVKFLYSNLCQWMMQRDMIQQNYAQFVSVQTTPHRKAETFTVEDVQRINTLAAGADNDKMVQCARLTMIMLFTGMRISELFLLPVSGIHLDVETPFIKGGIKTDAGKNRIIPIHSHILPFVRFFVENARGELFITGYKGQQKSNGFRSRDYYKMLEYLGISRKTPHNTRKSAATQAAEGGMDQVAMMKIFGWADMAVAHKYYIAPDVAYLSREMEALDAWSKLLELPEDGKS